MGNEGIIEASTMNRLSVLKTLVFSSTTALDGLVPMVLEPTQWLEFMEDGSYASTVDVSNVRRCSFWFELKCKKKGTRHTILVDGHLDVRCDHCQALN